MLKAVVFVSLIVLVCSCASRPVAQDIVLLRPLGPPLSPASAYGVDMQKVRSVLENYLQKTGGHHRKDIAPAEGEELLDAGGMIVTHFRGTTYLDPLATAIYHIIGFGDAGDVKLVMPFLKSYNPVHRHVAVNALERIATFPELDELGALLDDPDEEVRYDTLLAIANRKILSATDKVAKLRSDPDKKIREVAINVLKTLSTKSE